MNSFKQMGRMGFSMVVALVVAAAASMAKASSTATAYYQLGEADTSAASNTPPLPGDGGGAITVDSSGHGFNLTKSGTPTYSSNVPAGIGSSLSMAFVSADSDVYNGPLVTNASTNIRMDAWAYATNSSEIAFVALNGNGANGYGFLQFGTNWSFYEPFVSFNVSTDSNTTVIDPAALEVHTGQWVHLELVLDDAGHLSGYVNGTLAVTNTGRTPVAPTGGFILGGLDGNVDEVQLFTPEPASLGLLAIGGLALLRRRRR